MEVTMEDLKSKFELYKTVLNQIFVLLVAIGGGIGSLMVKEKAQTFVIIGSISIILLVIAYGIIFKTTNDIAERMKND